MRERRRGIPKICRCGEPVVMQTTMTTKNPGRLFHSSCNLSLQDWPHTFKWTDVYVYEEIEELIEKVDNIEETSMTLQKGFNVHENEIDNLAQETRVCVAMVNKEIEECKMQI
ncbi:hypothetical protein Bca52824_017441 [Brassica carinata]|uniref:Uncharacterized protein n=1 Tax=Brassica carinata TaxID=52824 RepID=A0A8X8AVD7_BRACI|nr:hypothetical protein Bca52824_017441 [Brassica carinata]